MSSSQHVIGFKPPDEKWKAMKKVWDACTAAGVEIPDEVDEFFNYESPQDRGVVVSEKDLGGAVKKYKGDMEDGWEINVRHLPPDVKIIRVYTSC